MAFCVIGVIQGSGCWVRMLNGYLPHRCISLKGVSLINNPESLVVVALGLFMVVLGFKGKTDNVIAAVKGQPYGSSTLQ